MDAAYLSFKREESTNDKLKKYLTSSELEALERLMIGLREQWRDAKFKLFGSKARGDSDEESDIDLLILLM